MAVSVPDIYAELLAQLRARFAEQPVLVAGGLSAVGLLGLILVVKLFARGNSKNDVRSLRRIGNYTRFWRKDMSADDMTEKANRIVEYEDVTNGYYDGATDMYEFAWGKSFHFSRYYKGESFRQAGARHEHYLAAQMGLRPGMRVLDVGCGVGGPAREIARFSDVTIVGINNNAFQVSRARKYTEEAGLSAQVSFVKGDFMKLSEVFGPNSFDAVYGVEATCHAPTFEGIYGEIFKVLKPGGVTGIYEWAMTDIWDPTNPDHRKCAHKIEIGDGIAEMRTVATARNAFQSVGFEMVHEEDLADRDDGIPWYYPLEGDWYKAQTAWDYFQVWRMGWTGRLFTHHGLWVAEKLGLVPKGSFQVGETLKAAGEALVDGGKRKLFTPMLLFVGRKPMA